jgi:hypothetical protein
MALEKLKETETETRTSLLSFQVEIQSFRDVLVMRRKRFDHIDQLPIEIFGEIARISVEDDHTTLIPLLHVCKRWRTVVENTPRLWAKLVLNERRAKSKAKLWIKRAKGKLDELIVRQGATWMSIWPGDSLEGLQWDNLLVFHCEAWAFLSYLQLIESDAAMSKWIELAIANNQGFPRHIPFLRGLSTPFSLRSLSLNNVQVDINETKFCEQIRNLRSCSLRTCDATSGLWANVIKANPLLERLELDRVTSVDTRRLSNILELAHLTTLEAISKVPVDIFTAKMPHLRCLILRSPSHDPCVFIQHLINTQVEGLTELTLDTCNLGDFSSLLLLLRQLPNLQVLEVISSLGVERLLDALSAHYIPPTSSKDDEPASDPSPILCPRLTHVNFSGNSQIHGELVMRLIKSRLIAELQTTSQIQSAGVARLESLIIDFCIDVKKEWVQRMQELVPYVSCGFMVRKGRSLI